MIMLKPPGKAEKIAKKVMKSKGVEQPASKSKKLEKLQTPYLQH